MTNGLHLHIISKETAKTLLMKRYFQAEKCSRGHICERYVNKDICFDCNKQRCKQRESKIVAAKYHSAMNEWLKLGREKKFLHIMSADSADSVSSRFYMSYRPCVNGHWSERRTSNHLCVECGVEAQKTDQAKQYQRDYAKRNHDKVLSYYEKYRNVHRDRRNANNAKWADKNIDQVRASRKNTGHKRRCQKSSGLTTKDLKSWQDQQKKVCYWCNRSCKKAFHIDHYVPLSKGGEHKLENLVIACPKCNLNKSAKDPYAFAKSVGRLF